MKFKFLLLFLPLVFSAQNNSKKLRVLFIGNSYTYVNNLPQMLADMATSMGDTLVFDSNCPGGYTFANHFQDAITKNKIALGTWQYVVLQAQSQEPAFPPNQVSSQTLPYAIKLDSLVKAANVCARTVFYETWGRKNGDAGNCPFYPAICTYTGMQNRLRESYLLFGDTCKALVAPAGEAWRASIAVSPTLELYQGDQSHPVVEGTYLTAAVFYEMLFRKSVLTSTYSAGLSAAVKNHLLAMAHATVQDSLNTWGVGKYVPDAGFTSSLSGNSLMYAANATNFTHQWNFGDGNSSTQLQGVHVYSVSGQFTLSHTVSYNCGSDEKTANLSLLQTTGLRTQVFSELIIESPFTTQITVRGGNSSEFVFRIVDLQGRALYQGVGVEYIDTGNWENGIYILEVQQGKEIQRYRVLKYAP